MMKDIIFDLGGVLIDWDPRYLYRKVFTTEKEVDWFLSNVCTQPWNTQQDAGRSFEEGIAQLEEKFPEYAFAIRFYWTRWEEMLGGEVPGTADILRALEKRGYRVYALSNWSAQTFEIAKGKFDFFNEFDGIMISGEEKLVKPDPQIFSRFVKKYNLQISNCVFIDDNAANISKAADLGFETIRFAGAEALQRTLVSRGIL